MGNSFKTYLKHTYKDFKITEVPFKYAQRWTKGDYDAEVCHLYITNT